MEIFMLVLLLCAGIASTQSPPYRLVLSRGSGQIAGSGNQLLLQCQSANQFINIQNAEFFRNGVKGDECIKNYGTVFQNGTMSLKLIPECEGYYQCGYAGALSNSTVVYAYPESITTTTFDQTITSFEGDNVTLPCSQRVSSLGSFIINWLTNRAGVSEQVDTGSINGDDYSITFVNVSSIQSGRYFCRVRSRPLNTASPLAGVSITLLVLKPHVNPRLLDGISYRLNANSDHIFKVTAQGTPTLSFEWSLDSGTLINSTEQMLQSANDIVNVQSEVILTSLPNQNSNLSVVITNTDNSGSVFKTTQSLFIFKYNESSNSCTNNYNVTSPVVSTPELPLEVIIGAGLGALCLLLFIVIIILSIVIHHLRHSVTKYRGSYLVRNDSNSTCGQKRTSLESSYSSNGCANSCNDSNTSQTCQQQLVSLNPAIHPLSLISSMPTPLLIEECSNPISVILIRIGCLYRNAELTETTLLRSLQQILIEALDNKNIVSSHEGMKCVKQLRDEITRFNDRIREKQFFSGRPCFSRQATVCSAYSARGSFDSASVNPVIIEEIPNNTNSNLLEPTRQSNAYSSIRRKPKENETENVSSVTTAQEAAGGEDDTDGVIASFFGPLEDIEKTLNDFIKKAEDVKKIFKSTKV